MLEQSAVCPTSLTRQCSRACADAKGYSSRRSRPACGGGPVWERGGGHASTRLWLWLWHRWTTAMVTWPAASLVGLDGGQPTLPHGEGAGRPCPVWTPDHLAEAILTALAVPLHLDLPFMDTRPRGQVPCNEQLGKINTYENARMLAAHADSATELASTLSHVFQHRSSLEWPIHSAYRLYTANSSAISRRLGALHAFGST